MVDEQPGALRVRARPDATVIGAAQQHARLVGDGGQHLVDAAAPHRPAQSLQRRRDLRKARRASEIRVRGTGVCRRL